MIPASNNPEGPHEQHAADTAPQARPANLPIVGHFDTDIGDEERTRAAHLAAELEAEEPRLASTLPFGRDVSCGLGPWPSLLIEDHSWIRLFERTGQADYAYRALLLAGQGDVTIIGSKKRCLAFERYCRDHLMLGPVELLVPRKGSSRTPLALRCVEDEALLDRVAQRARESGGLNVIPYMGTGGVWKLAGAISARARTDVRVAAPPPNLTRRANDKIWFARLVQRTLGPTALPQVDSAFGPASLAAKARQMADRHATVAVKLPNSASSAGNMIFDAAELRGRPLLAVRDRILSQLDRAGWQSDFPLLITAWEQPLLASPSVQIWIPKSDDGDPVVEGIFEQRLHGLAREFVGAAPSALPEPLQQRLADQSMRLALPLQNLGYFGRCSFDLILVGNSGAEPDVHWIECNGRWGGVSIPMTLANRLTGDWRSHPFMIVERSNLQGKPRQLEDFLHRFAAEQFTRAAGAGMVVLSPSRIEAGAGFEVMVIASALETAVGDADKMSSNVASYLEGKT